MSTAAHTLNVVAASAGMKVLKALIDECRSMPDVWQRLREFDQQQRIDRLRLVVDNAIKVAVTQIASSEFVSVPVTIASMTINDDASAKLDVERNTEAMHALADRVKQSALLVFADPARYVEGMEQIRAAAEQPEFELEDPPQEGESVTLDGDTVTFGSPASEVTEYQEPSEADAA